MIDMTTECDHGTYYPIEPCNPCALEDGRIPPLVRSTERKLHVAKYRSKCAGCGDGISVGDEVSFGGQHTGKRPWCAGCSTTEVLT